MQKRKKGQPHKGWKAAAKKKHDPDDDNESFADRAVQAELDEAMGIDNPDYDWLVEPYK